MASFAGKRTSLLTYLGINVVPMPTKRNIWLESMTVKDSFWTMTDMLSLSSVTPYQMMEEDEDHVNQTLFMEHLEVEGIVISSRSILRRGIEKPECRQSIFASSQRHEATNITMHECKSFWLFPRNAGKMLKVRVNEALDCSRILSVTRSHQDLECLISRWCVEIHLLVAAWGEFGSTLESVMNLTALTLYEETKAVRVALGKEDGAVATAIPYAFLKCRTSPHVPRGYSILTRAKQARAGWWLEALLVD